MCQKKNQPVNKLKISDHEEPPSLMNKNQMRGTYLLTYSLLEKKLLKLLIWIPPKPKQITGYVHWSQIKKDVNIITSQSNWVVQKRWLGVKNHLLFILSIKYANFSDDKHNNYYTAFNCISKSNKNVYTFKKLYGPFSRMGFNCFKAKEPLRGSSLLFATKFPEIPGTHLIDLEWMKGWVDLGATQWFWIRDSWIGNPAP